jgi:saccharopine dehydrogenase-like NADP-dependent oxidoreductase
MKILVLGGGAQGRVIADDLARSRPADRVTVADLRRPETASRDVAWIEADLASPDAIARLLREHDLGVGALPSQLGHGAMQAAIAARRPLVDVSFCAENPLELDGAARAAGVTIAPDCGLAPGLSHLLAGHAAGRHGTPREIVIMVGGVAEDPAAPYGYCVTWSLDDLMEEYARPARIVRDGAPATIPVFAEHEPVNVAGVGTMEAFASDGLRTIIETMPGVRDMIEKTLRWPGHVAAIRPLLAAGRLRDELDRRCRLDPPRDLVALVVRCSWSGHAEEWTMSSRYDPATGLTAMARTTALTTSVVAQLAADGGLGPPGVRPLERVGQDERAFAFIAGGMERRGVNLSRR